MTSTRDEGLLAALLDSWDRNHRIVINLLRALPEGGLAARISDSPSVAQLFTHIHYVRLAFVSENVPELGIPEPAAEWVDERDPDRILGLLEASAKAVRDAVVLRLESGQPMDRHYDHPILFLQHMIWHEGYHHGQIKLALKASGRILTDKAAGRVTWGVWMLKTPA